MANERKKYTEAVKREAVVLETSGKTIAEVARDLDITGNNLYWWRRLYGSQAQRNRHGNGSLLAYAPPIYEAT